MQSDIDSPKPNKSMLLAYVYRQAEYILNIPNLSKFRRYSQDPYIPRRYDTKDIDRFRVSNICTHITVTLLGILGLGAIISLVFWYPGARNTLYEAGYYVGIILSVLFSIMYFGTRRSIRSYLLRISPDRASGERRFWHAEVFLISLIGIVLVSLQAFEKLPFAVYIAYFLFFNSLFTFLSLIIYLRMRLKKKYHRPRPS